MNNNYPFPINYQQLLSVISQLKIEDKINLLKELQASIASEEPTIQLSKAEKKFLDEGLASIKLGKLIPDEKVKAQTRSKHPRLFE